MKIEYLADHKELVPILAKYNYDEWGKFFEGCKVEEFVERYAETTNKDEIPLTVVAFDESTNLLGFVSLIENDMESRQDLTPWLAALYVLPEHRGKGIACLLVNRIITEAKRLEIKQIYLFTGDDKRVDFYLNRGWKVIEKVKYKGADSVIMEYVC